MHNNDGPLYALPYRLRSARQKKRAQKEDADKMLIRLARQKSKLWRDQRNLPMVPLDQPYQKGWKRYFVLRADVRHSKNAAFYQTLLDKINTVQHSADRFFKVKKRRKRKRVYEVRAQLLREYSEREWNSPDLKLSEKEKAHFYPKVTWCMQYKCWEVNYVFGEPWRFVLQVRPHMITHVKMIDAQLESEIQRLHNYIEGNNLQDRMDKLTNGRVRYRIWWDEADPRLENPFKNRSVRAILDSIAGENIDQNE